MQTAAATNITASTPLKLLIDEEHVTTTTVEDKNAPARVNSISADLSIHEAHGAANIGATFTLPFVPMMSPSNPQLAAENATEEGCISNNVSSSIRYGDVTAPIPQELFTVFEKEENGSIVVAQAKNATMRNNPITVSQSIISIIKAVDEIARATDRTTGVVDVTAPSFHELGAVGAKRKDAAATAFTHITLEVDLTVSNEDIVAARQGSPREKRRNSRTGIDAVVASRSSIDDHDVQIPFEYTDPTSTKNGVHNSNIFDTSESNSNLATQGNFIVSSLDFGVDGGMIRPPKYIHSLPSTAKAKRKVGKIPHVVCETMLGNETTWSSNLPLNNNLMDVDDDSKIPTYQMMPQ
ncbi:hypothetical protein ACH5RR_012974 [Cinchona calisaya]|uniref:Uncharacterized protein n=1 Tax=Cinchona calisaya TaxID=153742 RepID=A0ABD3A1E0_9GENT